MRRSPFDAARLVAACPERRAERIVTAANASTGQRRGQACARRTSGWRSRHSQRRLRSSSEPSARVMEQARPTTNAAWSPRRRAITSIRVPVEEDADDGQADDLEIEPEGPALDVLDVVLDAGLQRRVAAKPVHLCPARDA